MIQSEKREREKVKNGANTVSEEMRETNLSSSRRLCNTLQGRGTIFGLFQARYGSHYCRARGQLEPTHTQTRAHIWSTLLMRLQRHTHTHTKKIKMNTKMKDVICKVVYFMYGFRDP